MRVIFSPFPFFIFWQICVRCFISFLLKFEIDPTIQESRIVSIFIVKWWRIVIFDLIDLGLGTKTGLCGMKNTNLCHFLKISYFNEFRIFDVSASNNLELLIFFKIFRLKTDFLSLISTKNKDIICSCLNWLNKRCTKVS